MIKYELVCDSGHSFDSWFKSSAAYDEQVEGGLVECPVCQSTKVQKAIMAPAVRRTDRKSKPKPSLVPDTEEPTVHVAVNDDKQKALRSMMLQLRNKMLEDAEDVGANFPEEARRMHDGDIPSRAIHGEATLAEAEALIEEGINILPIPSLPEDMN